MFRWILRVSYFHYCHTLRRFRHFRCHAFDDTLMITFADADAARYAFAIIFIRFSPPFLFI